MPDAEQLLSQVALMFLQANMKKLINFAGENAYYSCTKCDVELLGEQVGYVAAGRYCANGEQAPCPECGGENPIDRDDE